MLSRFPRSTARFTFSQLKWYVAVDELCGIFLV